MTDGSEQPRVALKEHMVSPEHSISQEYGRRIQTLSRLGILSILPTERKLGVRGLDGKEYPVPSLQQIIEVFKSNQALIKQKRKQGFTRLELVPLASPLAQLKIRAEEAIRRHAKDGKLFQAKRDPASADTPVRVNQEDPVYKWDRYLSADKDDGMVYFPKSLAQNHGGMSKTEAIQSDTICAEPGWSVTLTQDSPFLPKSPENNLTPNQYLQMLASSEQYAAETGFTPHDLLISFLTRLEDTNQVSFDWDNSSAAWLIGSYFPQEEAVPVGYWDRSYGELRLYRRNPGDQYGYLGLPSTVRLPNLKP